ncbi:hypothetical protein ABT173_10595 [Streptomyces sp. NPDC001795]|uniref:hypothetical protein n=1 Tax=unclassified Streptomyces TaxID=2593676 RepID=UPI003325C81B
MNSPRGVDGFWVDVCRRGTPLTGPDRLGSEDHLAVTFLWRASPATRSVRVLPNKFGAPRT